MDWVGLQRFYEHMESLPIDDAHQRAAVREAALQFRDFLKRVREPVPPELTALLDRLVARTP